MPLKVFLIIGLVFSPIGAVIAFLITYEEYTHHYADNKKPLRFAIQAAIVTFIVLFGITAIAGVFFARAF